jgi:PBSX family phage terminase large subunit
VNALPLGKKSREAISCRGFLTVYEGAVRSAKTVSSLVDWYNYIINSPEHVFLMSGNTLGSISRNCIGGDYGFIAITGGKTVPKTDTDGSKFLQLGPKRIYYCGADNEASFKKIRGLTIGGWYADEINLHAKSFIETALARSFASSDRKNIWTLNPDVPSHWIYKDYIDKYRDEQTPGYNWFHFTLDDNPALTEERKAEIAAQFSGIFYKRFVLGLRVRGEGGCYPSFVHNKPGEPGNVLDKVPERIYRTTFGLDFGGNKSATYFCCVGWFSLGGRLAIVILDEFYDPENKSVESVLKNWRAFYLRNCSRFPADRAFADSAEQLIIKSLNQILPAEIKDGENKVIKHVPMIHIENAMKRPIIDRIRLYDVLFSQVRAFIMRNCKHAIGAFENAIWDPKAEGEERLDDGSTEIDPLDGSEYAVERDLSQLVEGINA